MTIPGSRQADDPLRDEKGRWVAGTGSANPSGLPKEVVEALQLARSYAPAAVERLWQIASDDSISPKVRVVALAHLLDRALGKPAQSLTINQTNARDHESVRSHIQQLLADPEAIRLSHQLGRYLAIDPGGDGPPSDARALDMGGPPRADEPQSG